MAHDAPEADVVVASSPSPSPSAAASFALLPRWRRVAFVAAALLVVTIAQCVSVHAGRSDDLIVAAGRGFHTGTTIVTWDEPPHYDAYQRQKRFTVEAEPDGKARFHPLRGDLPDDIAARVKQSGWSLADLQKVVHLFVVHFDVCGTSRQCFKVLQDVRFLSVHFMLDVDGTIYQTLDLQERASHATIANSASIGIEIAHPGTALSADDKMFATWYARDEVGWHATFPDWMTETGIRTEGFVARPARDGMFSGPIHGRTRYQRDFTDAQYRALARLCAALHRVFPRIRLDAPRDESGAVRTTMLEPPELFAFDGIVGHFHVQKNKDDPGPAFDWERVLRDARAIAGE